VANASIRHGRKLAVVGTSMVDNVKITRKMGYLDIPDSAIVPIDQALAMKPAEVVLMCTGSQGEPTSILGKLSTGTNRQFDIQAGDTVVLSSQAIPGNEENVYRTINRLFSQGANVIYESVAPVHVSGHASQEELKLLLNLVNPKHYIPVHGELRHLKQNAMLAEQVGISPENIAVVENGQVIEFMNGKMRLGEKIPYSYIFVDGSGVGDVGPEVMREREALGRDGVVVVNVVIDRDGNIIENGLSITSHGFMADQEVENVLALAAKRISEKVSQSNGNLQKIIENDVRTFLYSETRRRPRVFVSVNQVGCSF
jgi:ribonuclease J